MKAFDHNVETGEVTERDLTKPEMDYLAARAKEDAAEVKKATELRAIRLAIFEKLGLTEDEIAILGL